MMDERHVHGVQDGPGHVQGVQDGPGHVHGVQDDPGHDVTGQKYRTGPDYCYLTGGWTLWRGLVMTRTWMAGTGYHCPRPQPRQHLLTPGHPPDLHHLLQRPRLTSAGPRLNCLLLL